MYADEHKAELLKLIMNAGIRYDVWRVFSDFCAMLADAISNSVIGGKETWRNTKIFLQEKTCS